MRTTSWSGGKDFVLSENLGRPTALYYAAAWCFTCIPEAQAWSRISHDFGDRLNVLILDPDQSESEADLLGFREAAKADGPMLWALGQDLRIASTYGVRALDSTIILDAEGKEVYRGAFPTSGQKLRSVLATLLTK